MAYRTEIERALDEVVSDEGNRFQTIAVIRAQQKWPRLIACERKWDGGLDAHSNGALEPDGKGVGLACSTTATIKKIKSDTAKTKEHYPDVRVLIFATTGKVTEHTKAQWAKEVADEFGLLRDECLNANWFTSLRDARRKIEAWRRDYNQERPHSSLDYMPPQEFAQSRAEIWG
jgi:Integrase core domain